MLHSLAIEKKKKKKRNILILCQFSFLLFSSCLCLSLLFLSGEQLAVRKQQVLDEEVLGKVVELCVVGPEAVGSCYAADAGDFMHVLFTDEYRVE